MQPLYYLELLVLRVRLQKGRLDHAILGLEFVQSCAKQACRKNEHMSRMVIQRLKHINANSH